MTITVVNKYHKIGNVACSFYCGRGSALGNKFEMKQFRSALLRLKERNRVCDEFEEHLPKLLLSDTPEGRAALRMIQLIHAAAVQGDVHLVCFCAPQRCHCETIKATVEARIEFNEARSYYC